MKSILIFRQSLIVIKERVLEILLPRIVFIPWFLAWLWLSVIAFIHRLVFFFSTYYSARQPSCICVEAGERGWQSIEFKELYQSASEYIGNENVVPFVVKHDCDYLEQLTRLLNNKSITHYLYDPRTGRQSVWGGLVDAFRVSVLLQRYNIVPIVLLTDLSVRTWRAQAAIVTARQGIVVCFMSARVVSPIFPHSRLIGPCLMPLSKRTRDLLDRGIRDRKVSSVPRAIFTGSLYEPRTSILKKIGKGVTAGGGKFECLGRVIGTKRVGDDEYWGRIINADIVFTTSVQMIQPGTDWAHIPHFLYRYLEVLACDTLLIAQEVPAVRRYLEPGVHYIGYESTEHAIELILYYLDNQEARESIASAGKKCADALVDARVFWLMIDTNLREQSIY